MERADHLDEGTIHAWLDDALSPDDAARVAAHVADCAACGAIVAEARGLIAASSRILSALDDDRSINQVNEGARLAILRGNEGKGGGAQQEDKRGREVDERDAREGVAANDRAMGGASRPPRRPWWRRTSYAAAAGIAFVALATTYVLREGGGVGTVADFAAESAPMAASVAGNDSAANAAERKDAPDRLAVQDRSAEQRFAPEREGAAQARTGTREQRAANAAADASGSSTTAAAGAQAPGSARPQTPPQRRGAVPVAPQVARAPSPEPSRRDTAGGARDSVAEAAKRAVAEAPPPADSARQRLSISADAVVRQEAERLKGEVRARAAESRELAQVTVTGTGAAAPLSNTVTAVQLAGCYRLERTTSAREGGVGERVQLETTSSGVEGGHPAYAVRELDAPAAAGAPWRWTATERGVFVLVRGEGELAARFPVAIDLGRRTGETSVGYRIECPGR